ncbi:Imm21 family immunity protein [Embleya sp. NPDC056575]|uniref:Imm21 family immunity protein n=1 Tax=unclassified Embleya TaxID=2699296 RepID=UPI00367FD9E3
MARSRAPSAGVPRCTSRPIEQRDRLNNRRTTLRNPGQLRSGTDGDYDRACEVMDCVGNLALPDGAEALLLGDEPLSTAYLPEFRVIVRWYYAESEDGVADIIRAGLPTAEWEQGPVLSVSGELVMFDAAHVGAEVGTLTDGVVLELAAGHYQVDSANIEPDDLMT